MSRTITSAQRRRLSGRAAARGMTVDQYLDKADRDWQEMQEFYRLRTDHDLQFAVIAQHAARNHRTFTRWSVQ